MSPLNLVIIGGVAGGASAAARARRLSEAANIIVFERGPHVSFANCGLPYFVGGEIAHQDDLLIQTPESLRARFNLDVRVRTEVVAIDRARRIVRARNLDSGAEVEQPYDALILSTGGIPLRPPIPGIDREGHFVVRNIPDVEAITAWIGSGPTRNTVIVGGGYIGLEMAEQLQRRGNLSVSVVEALPQVMAPLDPEMAVWLHAELVSQGVTLHLGSAVASFEAPQPNEQARASVVVLRNGRRLPADLVILGLGIRPETSLARDTGLTIGPTGGIHVDDQLRTSDPSIWAVGDAIEVRDLITQTPALIPLAGPANRQGRIAADNVFGRPSRYRGTLGTAILRLFNLAAGCTGANSRALARAGIPFDSVQLHPGSHAGYFPGAEPIALKILFDPGSGRLLGAQAVGRDGIDKRIDVLATAIQAGMGVEDLVDLELAYAPPFGSAKDPVNLAGMIAQNVLAKLVHTVSWDQIASLDPAKSMVLDVRSDTERRNGSIPGSVHIPLDQLRRRIAELPRNREIIVHCHTGQRSYFAARILGQAGFSVRNLSGSWRTWFTATTSVTPP